MSGLITFSDDEWYSAGRIFRVFADGITSELSETEEDIAVKKQFANAIHSNLNSVFVDTNFTDIMLVAFYGAFKNHLNYIKQFGKLILPEEIEYVGYIDRLDKLKDCMLNEFAARNLPVD